VSFKNLVQSYGWFHIVTYVYMLLGIVLKDRSKISVAADALIAFSFRV